MRPGTLTGPSGFWTGVTGPADNVTARRFAAGLGEPLGLAVVDGDLYVTQKGEVTRLRDIDGDDIADEYTSIASGWPLSYNYHEFSFNLVAHDGALWLGTSVPLKSGHTMYVVGPDGSYPVSDGPGSLIRVDPVKRTWSIEARGLRTPNGMGVGPNGILLGCDNQGSWVPCSRLNHLRPGGFYAHQEKPDGMTPSDPPVLWMPHNDISNSPAEIVTIAEGRFAGADPDR